MPAATAQQPESELQELSQQEKVRRLRERAEQLGLWERCVIQASHTSSLATITVQIEFAYSSNGTHVTAMPFRYRTTTNHRDYEASDDHNFNWTLVGQTSQYQESGPLSHTWGENGWDDSTWWAFYDSVMPMTVPLKNGGAELKIHFELDRENGMPDPHFDHWETLVTDS